jgi:hypothetical protein
MFLGALGSLTAYWGGWESLAIPEPNDENAGLVEHLLDRFDADALHVYSSSISDLLFANDPYGEQLRQTVADGLADARAAGQILVDETQADDPLYGFGEVPELVARLSRKSGVFAATAPSQVRAAGWLTAFPSLHTCSMELDSDVDAADTDLGLSERLMLALACGVLPPDADHRLGQAGVTVRRRTISSEYELWQSLDLLRRTSLTPWDISLRGLQPVGRVGEAERRPAVVVGDTPEDFALALALARWRPGSHWIPAANEEETVRLERLRMTLSSWLQRSSADSVLVCSFSDGSACELLRRQLGPLAFGGDMDWRRAIPDEPVRVVELESARRSLTVTVVDDLSHPLRTVEPRALGKSIVGMGATHWINEVAVDDWACLSNSALIDEVSTGMQHGSARCGRDGIAFLCPGMVVQHAISLESQLPQPRIRMVDLATQIRALAARSGWVVSESDKGVYARESTLLFGGTQGLDNALRDAATSSLIQLFIGDASPAIELANRRYLTFDQLRGDDAHRADILEELLLRGVVERGLALKCERCRDASWYSPTDLGQHVTCRRCRHQQPINRFASMGGHEPRWRYGLAEVVYQFHTHDGPLPFVVATDIAQAAHWGVSSEIAGELCYLHSDSTRAEVDIAVRVGSELTIGEATTSTRLKPTARDETERIARLLRIGDDLGASTIVIATTQPAFVARTRDRLRAMLGDRLDLREAVVASPQ